MIYKEHTLHLLDQPKVSKKDRYGHEYRRYYRNGWYKTTDGLNKINTERLLGKSLEYLSNKYLNRLNGEYHSIYWMLRILNINWGRFEEGEIQIINYGRTWTCNHTDQYYIHPHTHLVCVKRKSLFRYDKRLRMTRKERIKEYYENKNKESKFKREVKFQKQSIYDDLLHTITKQRKEKEEKLNYTKIISHGFDPITSFRNFPKQIK